jgi:hypothetical protein
MDASNGRNQIEELIARRRRVVKFLNALADLRPGDLQLVLRLDEIVPMEEDGPASLRTDQARTGRELATVLQDRLGNILALGRHTLGRK